MEQKSINLTSIQIVFLKTIVFVTVFLTAFLIFSTKSAVFGATGACPEGSGRWGNNNGTSAWPAGLVVKTRDTAGNRIEGINFFLSTNSGRDNIIRTADNNPNAVVNSSTGMPFRTGTNDTNNDQETSGRIFCNLGGSTYDSYAGDIVFGFGTSNNHGNRWNLSCVQDWRTNSGAPESFKITGVAWPAGRTGYWTGSIGGWDTGFTVVNGWTTWITLTWHDNVGTIQGIKVLMPSSASITNNPGDEAVWLDAGSPSTTNNPYGWGGISANTNHTVHVAVPSGYKVYYTLCYGSGPSWPCHNGPYSVPIYPFGPNGGEAYVNVNIPPNSTADLWWHYYPVDLVSQSLSVSGALNEGSTLTFSGQVHNQGAADYGSASSTITSFKLDLDYFVSPGYDLNLGNVPTSSLNPGVGELKTSGSWVAVAGTHRAEICADSTDAVAETNNGNNCRTFSFTVSSALITMKVKIFFDKDHDGKLDLGEEFSKSGNPSFDSSIATILQNPPPSPHLNITPLFNASGRATKTLAVNEFYQVRVTGLGANWALTHYSSDKNLSGSPACGALVTCNYSQGWTRTYTPAAGETYNFYLGITRPDLVITDTAGQEDTFNLPATWACGQPLTIQAYTKNSGGAGYISPPASTTTRMTATGSPSPSATSTFTVNPPLAVNSRSTLHSRTLTWNTAGDYTVTFQADVNSSLQYEESEANNTISKPITITACPVPDLTVNSYSTNPFDWSFTPNTGLVVNQPMSITATIRNNGNAATPIGVSFDNRINVTPNFTLISTNSNMSSLAANGLRTVTWVGTPTSGGSHTFTVCGDRPLPGVITESDETNNCGTYTIVVSSSLPWLKTVGGNVGSKNGVSAMWGLTGCPTNPSLCNATHMIIATTSIQSTFKSVKNWLVRPYSGGPDLRTYRNYSKFKEDFSAGACTNNTDTNISFPNSKGKYIFTRPSVTWNGSSNASCPTFGSNPNLKNVAVVFIEGNLTINNNLTPLQLPTVFIVRGNVTINSTVTQVDGMFVVDGSFNTGVSATQLTINGSVAAALVDNIGTPPSGLCAIGNRHCLKFGRTFTTVAGNSPAELINFTPKYLYLLSGYIGTSHTTTEEDNP